MIRVDSLDEPGRRGWDLCLGRWDGVMVDAEVVDVGEGGINPPSEDIVGWIDY